ncbi:MAG TPA: MBL fold metallo-hydrolase [Vicinamibacterales bacterium]|nr:MBL fold metallo-hydrolase [Vicinamibacterales bacterium]
MFVLSVASCTPKPPEQQFVDDAMRAVGGRAKIDAVKSIVIEGAGVNYNLGQDMKPEAATQQFAVSPYKREIDVEQGRQRIEQTRTPKFAFFQGPQPQVQIQVLDGDIGFNVAPNGTASRLTGLAERDRRIDYFHHPVTALKAATATEITKISNVRTVGNVRQADFAFRDRQWTMTIDPSGLPLSISSKAYNANLGDVVITTTFADYQDSNGLKLPARITGRVDDFTIYDIQASKQSVDAALGNMSAPPAVVNAISPPPPNVTVESIGKGVWFLAGGSHNSVLVEFGDHLMLIEAPQSEARAMAVIKKARETVPKKPLTELVTSHHHFDHTAGMRAAIAEGLTVITQAGNKAWVDNMARRPHTLQQDFLAKNSSRLHIDTVDEDREFKDQTMTLMLYHVAGNPHSDTMLMAYIPRDRLLIEADAFSPGAQVNPYAANLLENIRKRNLRVDKIVPLHGTITPFAELGKVAEVKGTQD